VQKSAGKVLASIFWDPDSILLIDYLPKDQTIKLLLISAGVSKEHFEGKSPRKFTKGALFLHDNASSHRALAIQKNLAYLGFQYLDNPPFSLYLPPSDYHLFLGLKKLSKVHHFSSDAEVIPAAETWLYEQYSDFFEWFAKFRATD
jgi:hypothetical protein